MHMMRAPGVLALLVPAGLLACAGSGARRNLECIAPANPGGGWDLACRALVGVVSELRLVPGAVRVTNMPGAGGGVALAHTVTQRERDRSLIVAASPATTLRLAQGQYQRFTERDVRWLAALGAEYGVLAVGPQAPWENLDQLVAGWRTDPAAIAVGGGSAVGGQDHMKVLLLARSAGLDPRVIRYVAFNGGGEALTALLGGFIQVFSGDASEIEGQLEAGNLRVLAVLGPQRLEGRLAGVPTAREQGYDVEWATWRGYYVPAGIADTSYDHWVELMRRVAGSPQWARAREAAGLEPFVMMGPEFQAFVEQETARFRALSREVAVAQTDPLGPRAFPLLAGLLVAVAGGLLLAGRGGPTTGAVPVAWPRLALAAASLLVYGRLLVPLGFIAATALEMAALSLLFGGRARTSLIAAVLFSLSLYGLFAYGLELGLPTGRLFGG